jgi:hypothetical protein
MKTYLLVINFFNGTVFQAERECKSWRGAKQWETNTIKRETKARGSDWQKRSLGISSWPGNNAFNRWVEGKAVD